MKLTFASQVSGFAVSDGLLDILRKELTDKQQATNSVILNFHSPEYSPEHGGYHPVEIRLVKLNGLWHFDYITDFSYQGVGYMSELTKEIDFCFNSSTAYHLYAGELNLKEGQNLFKLWQSNFVSYCQMGVFQVEVTTD